MKQFKDIVVSRYTRFVNDPFSPQGGPHYPDFESCTWERHLRRKNYYESVTLISDKPPKLMQSQLYLSGSWSWVGPAEEHFGHHLAEFSTRIAEAGNAGCKKFLFARVSRTSFQTKERLVTLAKWFGGSDAIIYIVDHPVMVEELIVFPQGEIYTMPPTSDYLAYLEIAQKRNEKNDISFTPGSKYFFSRQRFDARIAGELYIAELLIKNGWISVNPEELSLLEQINIFSYAEEIIVIEGSAIHTAHLLAKIRPRITIINRRQKYTISEVALQCRKANFEYIDCVSGVLAPMQKFYKGVGFNNHLGMSIVDCDMLLELLVARFNLEFSDVSVFRRYQTKDLLGVILKRRLKRFFVLLWPSSIKQEQVAWREATASLVEPYKSKLQKWI